MICPYCNNTLTKFAKGLPSDETIEVDGKPVVCLFCGEISITENKQLRVLTAPDVLAIVNAGFWSIISFDSYHLKDKIRKAKQ